MKGVMGYKVVTRPLIGVHSTMHLMHPNEGHVTTKYTYHELYYPSVYTISHSIDCLMS